MPTSQAAVQPTFVELCLFGGRLGTNAVLHRLFYRCCPLRDVD
jgi:hypothetical protein